MPDILVYEQPLNERTRLLLRLDFLFRQFAFFHTKTDTPCSRQALDVLVAVLNIVSRYDIKSEILKELERHLGKLAAIKQSPNIDGKKLDSILKSLQLRRQQLLQKMPGKVGQELREHALIKSVIQRSSIPASSCDFDLPTYYLWLQRSAEERCQDLSNWYAQLEPIKLSVELLIELIRSSGAPKETIAVKGKYQRNLNKNTSVQLIRVSIPESVNYIAEISAGKHRFSIYFQQVTSFDKRPVKVEKDVAFVLTQCIL